MLYKIDNKFYIKVQGYYKEVDIKVNGDNLDITPNGNEIEVSNVKHFETYDMRMNKADVIKQIEKKSQSSENPSQGIFEQSERNERSRNRNRRV